MKHPFDIISEPAFVAFCAGLTAAFVVLLPSYYPLLQPDSLGYTDFASSRTSFYPLFLKFFTLLGFSLEAIVYVQTVIFSLAFIVLVRSLLAFAISRVLVIIFVVALGANIAFSSVHKTILTESIYVSVSTLMLAWMLDYFRTGRAVFIALASLCVGILYGVRPAAIVLLPMIMIAVMLMWQKRNLRPFSFLACAILPLLIGPAVEAFTFHLYHKERSTVIPYMMMGKAAMLVQPGMTFYGPHAVVLKSLSEELNVLYEPAHKFLREFPSVIAWPIISSTYEGVGQFSILTEQLDKAAASQRVASNELRNELGWQIIRNNISGFVRLSLLNYFGQWSVTALTFPPAARATNDYVNAQAQVPLGHLMSYETLHPSVATSRYVVYPAFLAAGIVSALISPLIFIFILRQRLSDGARARKFMVATFFAVMCQIHTLVIAIINVPTPRFLLVVYPQIVLMFIFLWIALRQDSQRMTR